jgi:hypothetical protein
MTKNDSPNGLAASREGSSMTRRLRAVLACMLAALALPFLIQAHQGPLYQTPKNVTELDGSKDPASIPDYAAWRTAFRFLANMDHNEGEKPLNRLMLPVATDAERAVILKVAERSSKAWLANRERQDAAMAAFVKAGDFSKKATQKVDDEIFAIDYEQRVTTLEERDALLPQLTDEARMNLEAAIEKVRRGMAITVATSELARFRLPS